MAPAQAEFLRINYSGKVGQLDTRLITRYVMKGFLTVGSVGEAVNHINAPTFAQSRGIRVTDSNLPDSTEYTDLIEVYAGKEGDRVCAAGTFFGKEPRIVRLRDRKLNVVPRENLLLLENDDIPGIVGEVGRVLGEGGVNIANMSLGRNNEGHGALMALNIDTAPDQSMREALEAINGINSAKLITFGS